MDQHRSKPQTEADRITTGGLSTTTRDALIGSAKSKRQIINDAYAGWVEQLVAAGWTPYLLTLMFRSLVGSPASVARQMEREAERLYATHLPRVVRHPVRTPLHRLPIWFCAHDRPVFKHLRQNKRNILPNDGRHMHAVMLNPPWSRLRNCLATHFEQHIALYVRHNQAVVRLDVSPITQQPGHAVDYVRKQVGRAGPGEDVDFTLPREHSEMH